MIYIMHNGECTAAFGTVFYEIFYKNTLVHAESGKECMVCVYGMSMDVFTCLCAHICACECENERVV